MSLSKTARLLSGHLLYSSININLAISCDFMLFLDIGKNCLHPELPDMLAIFILCKGYVGQNRQDDP